MISACSTLVFTKGEDGKLSRLSIARWRGWGDRAVECAASLPKAWLTELDAFRAKLRKTAKSTPKKATKRKT